MALAANIHARLGDDEGALEPAPGRDRHLP